MTTKPRRASLFMYCVGTFNFILQHGTFDLQPGQLLALDPGITHSVDASEESAFLLTLSDPQVSDHQTWSII